MNKKEFMKGLEQALTDNMSLNDARVHLNYYNDYINSEINKGKSEEDVIKQLGNPRLIAKSLTSAGSANGNYYHIYEEQKKTDNKNVEKKGDINMDSMKSFLKVIIGVIIVVVVLAIIAKIAWFLLKIIVPIVLLGIVVGVAWKFISEKR